MSRERYRPCCGYSTGAIFRNEYYRFNNDSILLNAPDVNDSFVDRFVPGQSHGNYNVCFHTRYDPAVFIQPENPMLHSDFWSGEPQFVMSIDKYFVVPSGLPSLDPSPDWISLISTLGDDVIGRLQAKTQLGVTLGMMAKTYRMVTNPFGLLKADWRQLAGHNSMSSLAEKGTNLYLEGRYGWRVLRNDMRSFCKAADKFYDASQPVVAQESDSRSLVRRQVYEASTPSPSMSDYAFFSAALYAGATRNTQGGIARVIWGTPKVEACLACHALRTALQQYSAIDKFRQTFGLTFRDAWPTIWNLIPYSFVVDWFVDQRVLGINVSKAIFGSESVSRLGYSMKVDYPFKVQWIPCVPWSSNADPGYFAVSDPTYFTSQEGCIHTYSRTRGLPDTEGILTSKGLSLMHGVDATALLMQRVLR